MLPAAARMRRPAEFAAAVRSGARAGSPMMTVHACRSSDHSDIRVGFVVTRAVGSAVVRNRLRRQLRHLMRARLAGLPGGLDLVVRANAAAVGRPSSALAPELDRALDKALRRVGPRASLEPRA